VLRKEREMSQGYGDQSGGQAPDEGQPPQQQPAYQPPSQPPAYQSAPAMGGGAPSYPVTFDVEYPEGLSRLLLFVKWLLVIPHLIILWALSYVASAISLIAFFAILFTKRYPRGLFDIYVGVRRWNLNAYAYGLEYMRDEYPPFSWDSGKYPVSFEVEYPEELSRFAPLYKWLLAIPHYIVLIFLVVAMVFVVIAAWFAILFTGKFPQSWFRFVEGVLRWAERVNAYVYLLRDEYPPFSLT
jgi:hypothetical protein